MLDEFNKAMEVNESVVRLNFGGYGRGTVETVLSNYKFVYSVVLNLTDEFYKMVDEFFKSKEIKISYNNTGTIFWETKDELSKK